MTANLSALDQYVEQHLQESLEELALLCAQSSISAQGVGMHACADLVAELLRSRGMTTLLILRIAQPDAPIRAYWLMQTLQIDS